MLNRLKSSELRVRTRTMLLNPRRSTGASTACSYPLERQVGHPWSQGSLFAPQLMQT